MNKGDYGFLRDSRSQATVVRVGNRVIISGVVVLLLKALVVCEVLLIVLERYLKHSGQEYLQMPENQSSVARAHMVDVVLCLVYACLGAHTPTHTAIKFLF